MPFKIDHAPGARHRPGPRELTALLAGLMALNATTGDPLWHARLLSPISNAPITYELDGLQYVTVAAGTLVISFLLNR